MELNNFNIKRNRSKRVFYLCGLGDIHYGNINCDENALEKAIAWINKTDAYVIGMGDMIEAINPNDKRFDFKSIKPELLDNLGDLVTSEFNDITTKYLDKIPKERWIGIHTGNHEEVIRKRYYRDITEELCNRYKCKNLGYAACTTLRIYRGEKSKKSSHVIKIYSHHGYGGARFAPTKRWKIEHLGEDKDYDILLMGHVHVLDGAREIKQTINNLGDLVEKTIIKMITGTFLRTGTVGARNYAEEKGYGITKTGIGTVKINIERSYIEHEDREYIDMHLLM